MINVIVGLDIIVVLLFLVIYYLYKYFVVKVRFIEEIDFVVVKLDGIIIYVEVIKFFYFIVVINEVMRIYFVIGFIFECIVFKGGVIFYGVYFFVGIVVGVNLWVLY